MDRGLINASHVATALPLVWQITNMAGWVSFEIAGIFENIGVVQDGMETITVPHSLVDDTDAKPLKVAHGEIRFDQVSFGYGSGRPIFDNINLVVRPGERVGLIGRSGAGKSTLVNLLLRFFDIEQGRILDRRPGCQSCHAGKFAHPDRTGYTGYFAAASLDCGQYPLWPSAGDTGGN